MESVISADISEDGNHVAYLRAVPADPYKENKPASYHLYVYNLETKHSIPFLTRASARAVSFRPGADAINFLARMEGDANTCLYEMSLMGGEARKLYEFETSITDYAWSADGTHLAFIADEPQEASESSSERQLPYEPIVYEEDPTYSIGYVMEWEEREPQKIRIPGDFHALAWSPDGNRLAVSTAPTPLIDDYYMKQRISIVDAQSLKEIGEVGHAGKLGHFAWSPDSKLLAMIAGATINDPIAGRLFVVDAKGGEPQMLRPEAEMKFDDIVDGVDHIIANYPVDENKVGVTGGSYGGYATGWMATRYTDRFAAGVMFVGISDNISKWGTTDIPEELYLVHARKRIWEDYQFFLERSPIYYADQTKTPLLIMAGEDDTRVDPSQSVELYRHIRTRTETPARLVLYPGEGHGNRNASARLDYSLRMLGWFNKYLKGEESDYARPDR
jgi:dipeptidyl aminopeptidase/acylaminoacyl peptidase